MHINQSQLEFLGQIVFKVAAFGLDTSVTENEFATV